MDDEPGIDLSNPPPELGVQEQLVMDLLTSTPWFVTSMEDLGPGEITVTITIPI